MLTLNEKSSCWNMQKKFLRILRCLRPLVVVVLDQSQHARLLL